MTISFLVTVIAQVLILALIAKAILSWLPRIGVLTPGRVSLAKGETYSTPCEFSAKLMTKEKYCSLVDREMVLEYA